MISRKQEHLQKQTNKHKQKTNKKKLKQKLKFWIGIIVVMWAAYAYCHIRIISPSAACLSIASSYLQVIDLLKQETNVFFGAIRPPLYLNSLYAGNRLLIRFVLHIYAVFY